MKSDTQRPVGAGNTTAEDKGQASKLSERLADAAKEIEIQSWRAESDERRAELAAMPMDSMTGCRDWGCATNKAVALLWLMNNQFDELMKGGIEHLDEERDSVTSGLTYLYCDVMSELNEAASRAEGEFFEVRKRLEAAESRRQRGVEFTVDDETPVNMTTIRMDDEQGRELAKFDLPSAVVAQMEAAARSDGKTIERWINDACWTFLKSCQERRQS